MAADTAEQKSRPIVLLLSLDKMEFWDEQHAKVVDDISARATIKRVTKAEPAVRFLSEYEPLAIIITDPATAQPNSEYDAIRLKLVEYVNNGGTAIMATHWSSFVTRPNANRWFNETWQLPWEFGDYHRTDFVLHKDSIGARKWTTRLPDTYSQKAVFLKNVAREDGVYWPGTTSQTQSMVFAPGPVDRAQSPVIFKKVGAGYLGYIGDVNGEKASQAALLTMCGL